VPTSQGVQERALAGALKARPSRPEDAAIEALARRLAQVIDVLRGEEDEPSTLTKLAAEYRQALTALGLTPHARAQMIGKTPPPVAEKPKSALQRQRDELAAQREKRAAGT
jgi:hypothetical protein